MFSDCTLKNRKTSASYRILTCFLLFVSYTAFRVPAQSRIPHLSEDAVITLLTCDPGEYIYSIFGHSAIRIFDPDNRMDRVYNYGTFDFDEPGFVWKFTRGKLNYKLSVNLWRYFLEEYQYDQRSVYSNEILLTLDEKQILFENLEVNCLPENQYYKYDFFFDNCATRIRDIMDRSIPAIRWQDSSVTLDSSFRDLIDIYLLNSPWADFGIDLGIGLPADAIATHWQITFLPDFLQSEMMAASIDGRPGNLMGPTKTLYAAPVLQAENPLPLPSFLAWGIFVLVAGITFAGIRMKKKFRLFDKIFFGIVGLLGWFILFLWLGTDHIATANNLNLLWANPVLLPLPFLNSKSKMKRTAAMAFKITGSIALLCVIAWAFLPQDLHEACLPLAMAVGIRTLAAGWVRF